MPNGRRTRPGWGATGKAKGKHKPGWGSGVSENPRVVPHPLTFRAPSGATGVRLRAHARYSPAVANRICERIMQKETLTAICKDPNMPSIRAVIRWLSHPETADFREMYYYARRIQAEMLVDEIIDIADGSENDWKPRFGKNGRFVDYVPDNEAIQRSRVRIDARKWFAAKMMPRIYGENLHTEHEVVGDLAELLKSAVNKDRGLPQKPIEHEVEPDAEG